MATRGTIALEFQDGTIGMIYCHWDNYLEHTGKILLDHYTDPFLLRELIDLGDLSILGKSIGVKHNFNDDAPDQCTFYGRDRGEEDTDARYFKNFDEYTSQAQFEEYNYCLRQVDGQPVWFVNFEDTQGKWITLSKAFAALAVERLK